MFKQLKLWTLRLSFQRKQQWYLNITAQLGGECEEGILCSAPQFVQRQRGAASLWLLWRRSKACADLEEFGVISVASKIIHTILLNEPFKFSLRNSCIIGKELLNFTNTKMSFSTDKATANCSLHPSSQFLRPWTVSILVGLLGFFQQHQVVEASDF